MTLEPVPDRPGVWENPRWQPGTPGSFAMVIGVSRYDHLDGSEEAFLLDQLQVSALTAYRVFEWLGNSYHVEGCPIARCWLLLSPTGQEHRFEPGVSRHILPPTLDNCRKEIGWWWNHMRRLPPDAAQASRGFFFFSGHGFEMYRGNQLLLPSDYLSPPVANWNDAISTGNLEKGLASLQVPLQMFFVDACRNAPTQLRKKKVKGTDILPEDNNEAANPAYVSPVLYATTGGQRAFQHPEPALGLSLFGRALLDGLAGKPDLKLAEVVNALRVNLFPLQEFTEARVLEALARAREIAPQPVVLGGTSRNALVTELPPQPWKAADRTLRVQQGADADLPLAPGDRLEAIAAEAASRQAQGNSALTQGGWLHGPRSGWAADYDRAHDFFGSESATWMWMRDVELFAVADRRHVDDVNAVHVWQVAHDEGKRHWKVELSLLDGDRIGHALQLRDESDNVWTILLPAIPGSEAARFLVEFELTPRGRAGTRALSRLEGSVSPSNSGPAGAVARLWQAYRYAGVSRTLAALQAFIDQEDDAFLSTPMATVLGGLLALRLGDERLVEQLIGISQQNIVADDADIQAGIVPGLTVDFAALMAGYLTRRRDAVEPGAGAGIGRVVLAGGVPRTTEGLLVARAAVESLLRLRDVPAEETEILTAARARLELATDLLAGDGMFTTYAHATATDVLQALATPLATARNMENGRAQAYTAGARGVSRAGSAEAVKRDEGDEAEAEAVRG